MYHLFCKKLATFLLIFYIINISDWISLKSISIFFPPFFSARWKTLVFVCSWNFSVPFCKQPEQVSTSCWFLTFFPKACASLGKGTKGTEHMFKTSSYHLCLDRLWPILGVLHSINHLAVLGFLYASFLRWATPRQSSASKHVDSEKLSLPFVD